MMWLVMMVGLASGLETFLDVASRGGTVKTRISFESRVPIIGTNRTYSGEGTGIFTGASAGLFDVRNTTLGLENLRLENCNATMGGCITAEQSSVVNLTNVVAVNCWAIRGGVAALNTGSSLVAVSSLFLENRARDQGGVVVVEGSSTFEAITCNFQCRNQV